MGKVIASQSISIDGYSAGIKAGRDNPLGEDGERLHEWLYGLDSWRGHHNLEGGESNADAELLDELFANLGAVIMGRTMFECGEGPWGDEPPFHVPVFVLAHEPRDSIEKHGGTSFTFVHEGDRARPRARATGRRRQRTSRSRAAPTRSSSSSRLA